MGSELSQGCAGSDREMHSNEEAGGTGRRVVGVCVGTVLQGESLELGGRPIYSLVSVSHHLWVALGKGEGSIGSQSYSEQCWKSY